MPRATLIIDVDTSAITRSLGEIPRIAQRSQAAMTSAVRAGGRQRLTLDQQFTREHEAISVRLARAKERRAKEETDKLKAEERKRVQADGEFARLKDGIHAQLVRAKEQREKAATRVEEAEGRRRLAVDRQFNREKDRAHAAMIRDRQRREREAQRESDRLTRERREQGGRAGELVALALHERPEGEVRVLCGAAFKAALQFCQERLDRVQLWFDRRLDAVPWQGLGQGTFADFLGVHDVWVLNIRNHALMLGALP